MLEVKIKSKKTNIKVLNENDEVIGILSFYPTDLELPKRAEEGQKRIEELIRQMKENSMNMSKEEFLDSMHELNEKTKELLNYIFDDDIGQLFGNTSMFTPTSDGTLLVENILDGILPVVTEQIKENMNKSSENMRKYLEDYEKK